MAHHVFGIRHHGPGSARALLSALEALAPDVVLIEGPPDADELLGLVADEGLVPPVALLVHAADDPQRAVFYPYAVFSPEWQALRFAARRGVPARFMDLPCAHGLAEESAEDGDRGLREDPIGLLSEAAGHADRERWWELEVEQRRDSTGLFEGILDAMRAMREGHEETSLRERRREAHMRQTIRAAQKEGFERIAVVCGAWHAPALAALGPARADAELLKGMPRIKVACTWIPWTHARLSFRSGYGAGVDSPGWYAHVWEHAAKAPVVWATRAARLLRAEDLDASAANVIETVRLAETLAAIRELATPSLLELRESIAAVLTHGEEMPLALVRDRLEVGDALGSVPEAALTLPLVRDLEREAKRLRLKVGTEIVELDLDLRKEGDRDRSRLLHRLSLLGVTWGTPRDAGRTTGTFREGWRVAWRPELSVDLASASLFGNTVEAAATNKLVADAREAVLATLAVLVERAMLAALPDALDPLLRELDARAATSADVAARMLALPPLVRLARYGDVRGTRAEAVLPLIHLLFERILVGLPSACTQLDDDAALERIASIDAAHAACNLLDDAPLREAWIATLDAIGESAGTHPRIRGRLCRILVDQGHLDGPALALRAGLALGPAVEAAEAAAYVEGLVTGAGLSLVHRDELLGTLDAWLAGLDDDAFRAQLPLLRRAFSALDGPERRAVAAKLGRAAAPRAPAPVEAPQHDPAIVASLLPVLAHLLGAERA